MTPSDFVVWIAAYLFPINPKPYASTRCERCGCAPASDRGLCDPCYRSSDNEEIFI